MAALWHCMWRRDLRGKNATCSAFSRLSITSPATHKQIGPFWCCLLGGWVCVHCRTLWVSPMNSPVRQGVSSAAPAPQVFIARGFEALFPYAGTLGCAVCLASQLFLLVYLNANVGPPNPPAATSPCVLSAPTACICPSYQSG